MNKKTIITILLVLVTMAGQGQTSALVNMAMVVFPQTIYTKSSLTSALV